MVVSNDVFPRGSTNTTGNCLRNIEEPPNFVSKPVVTRFPTHTFDLRSVLGLPFFQGFQKKIRGVEPVEAQAAGSLVAVRSCVAVAEGTWVMSLWMASAWVGMALNGTV